MWEGRAQPRRRCGKGEPNQAHLPIGVDLVHQRVPVVHLIAHLLGRFMSELQLVHQ
jgi:hypothetical protein